MENNQGMDLDMQRALLRMTHRLGQEPGLFAGGGDSRGRDWETGFAMITTGVNWLEKCKTYLNPAEQSGSGRSWRICQRLPKAGSSTLRPGFKSNDPKHFDFKGRKSPDSRGRSRSPSLQSRCRSDATSSQSGLLHWALFGLFIRFSRRTSPQLDWRHLGVRYGNGEMVEYQVCSAVVVLVSMIGLNCSIVPGTRFLDRCWSLGLI